MNQCCNQGRACPAQQDPQARIAQLEALLKFADERINKMREDQAAQLAAVQQSVPVAYLRFWAWQHAGSPDSGPDQDEGFEVCLPSDKGVDGSPAFPVYTHPTQQGLEPTMFWDADDPERCESSINNVVVEADSYRGLRVGDIVTIQRAVRLPNLEVRITQCPDAEGNGDLEWDEADAAQAKQGGV